MAKRAAVVGVAGLAIYLVLPAITEVFASWPRLSTLDPRWFALAIGAEIAHFCCTFALQRLALRTREWFPVVTSQLAATRSPSSRREGRRWVQRCSSGCWRPAGWTRARASEGWRRSPCSASQACQRFRSSPSRSSCSGRRPAGGWSTRPCSGRSGSWPSPRSGQSCWPTTRRCAGAGRHVSHRPAPAIARAPGTAQPGYLSCKTARMLPAGSLNQAMYGPPARLMPFSSWPSPS